MAVEYPKQLDPIDSRDSGIGSFDGKTKSLIKQFEFKNKKCLPMVIRKCSNLDPYFVHKGLLGFGSCGVVFEVDSWNGRKTPKRTAIKVFQNVSLRDAVKEARRASKLKQINIVKCYDWWIEDLSTLSATWRRLLKKTMFENPLVMELELCNGLFSILNTSILILLCRKFI